MIECNVCMDRIHTYGVIRCGHIYCFCCINSWAARANKCPLCKCRFNVIKKIADGKAEFVRVEDREAEADAEIDPVLFGELSSQRLLLRVREHRRRGAAARVRVVLHGGVPHHVPPPAAPFRARREVVLRLLRAGELSRTGDCGTSCPSPAYSLLLRAEACPPPTHCRRKARR